jgi:hypothetical protein
MAGGAVLDNCDTGRGQGTHPNPDQLNHLASEMSEADVEESEAWTRVKRALW